MKQKAPFQSRDGVNLPTAKHYAVADIRRIFAERCGKIATPFSPLQEVYSLKIAAARDVVDNGLTEAPAILQWDVEQAAGDVAAAAGAVLAQAGAMADLVAPFEYARLAAQKAIREATDHAGIDAGMEIFTAALAQLPPLEG